MMGTGPRAAKDAVRRQVWDCLEQAHAAPGGAHGRIPAFVGAQAAADRLAALPLWVQAQVIKVVPDHAQEPVRTRALADGKTVYMAVPKLASTHPFVHLGPAAPTAQPGQVAGQPVSLDQMHPVDLIICGSVAVNRDGARLGKGAGYADLEIALLYEAGLITPATMIVTTVHPLQVLNQALPQTRHDATIDLIVTPDHTITCTRPRHSTEIYWDDLTPHQIAAIPILQALQPPPR
jgi:5-formyltetrahydrofolate cyclo-ligase